MWGAISIFPAYLTGLRARFSPCIDFTRFRLSNPCGATVCGFIPFPFLPVFTNFGCRVARSAPRPRLSLCRVCALSVTFYGRFPFRGYLHPLPRSTRSAPVCGAVWCVGWGGVASAPCPYAVDWCPSVVDCQRPCTVDICPWGNDTSH